MRRRIRSDAFIGTVERILGIGNSMCHKSGRNIRSDCKLGTLRRKGR